MKALFSFPPENKQQNRMEKSIDSNRIHSFLQQIYIKSHSVPPIQSTCYNTVVGRHRHVCSREPQSGSLCRPYLIYAS